MYKIEPFLQKILNLKHGFFGREGGVSQGPFATLNGSYTVGDLSTHVTENRHRACEALGSHLTHLVTLNQVHGSDVYILTSQNLLHAQQTPPQADGIVTRESGLLLGLLTADCAPLLWVDAEAGVIGACHAGWRGGLGTILENTLGAMEKLGACKPRIKVAIGPMIHASTYTVDLSLYMTFLKEVPFSERFFMPHETGYQFNLLGFLIEKLQRLGLQHYAYLSHSTFEGPFFSYRRSQRKEEMCGRNLSLIQWN